MVPVSRPARSETNNVQTPAEVAPVKFASVPGPSTASVVG